MKNVLLNQMSRVTLPTNGCRRIGLILAGLVCFSANLSHGFRAFHDVVPEPIASFQGSYDLEILKENDRHYLTFKQHYEPFCELKINISNDRTETLETEIEKLTLGDLDQEGPFGIHSFFKYSIRKQGVPAVIFVSESSADGPIYKKYADGRANEIINILSEYGTMADRMCDSMDNRF